MELWTIPSIYQYQIFKQEWTEAKKEWTEAMLKNIIQMHNGKYQCHMAACCAYHRPTHFLTAKQEPYKKAYLLMTNIEEFSGKSLEERASRQEKIRQNG